MLESRALLSAAPVFSQSSYDFTIPENSTCIGGVSATDDEGIFGYMASDSNFWIDGSGTISTMLTLDYESLATNPITFTVTVCDSEMQMASATVSITITDVAEDPIFNPTSYTFSIAETAASGTVVGSLSATDPQNDISGYSLSGTGADSFSISMTGQITVIGALDFESAPTRVLTATVYDMQGSATATVTINVTDVAEDPVFNPTSYTFSISEDAAIGTVVGSVTATDPQNDISGYSVNFVGVGGTPPFYADSIGNIVLSGSLDFETTETYALTVAAYDMQGSGTATVTINVIDVIESNPLPTVSIAAVVSTAKEVGLVHGRFRISRSVATPDALVVALSYPPPSSATSGEDYEALPESVTILPNETTVDLDLIPLADVYPNEGTESVTCQIVDPTDEFGNQGDYVVGSQPWDTIDIRDRAAANKLVVIGGDVTGIPSDGTGRDVTSQTLELTQGDQATFKVLYTPNGDIDPADPLWVVTGQSNSLGSSTKSIVFDQWNSGGTTTVSVATFGIVVNATVRIIPMPMGITSTATPLVSMMPQYSGFFRHSLSAAGGATPLDLLSAMSANKLRVERSYGYFLSPALLHAMGTDDLSMEATGSSAVLLDPTLAGLFTPLLVNGLALPSASLFGSHEVNCFSSAADSLSTDSFPIATLLVIFEVDPYGIQMGTTNNGAAMSQPIASIGPLRVWDTPGPYTISHGGTLSIDFIATVQLTAADITAGSKTVAVEVWDRDIVFHDLLWSGSATVTNLGLAAAGQWVAIRVSFSLSNPSHKVEGTSGSSGEIAPNIFFKVDGIDSGSITVTAL